MIWNGWQDIHRISWVFLTKAVLVLLQNSAIMTLFYQNRFVTSNYFSEVAMLLFILLIELIEVVFWLHAKKVICQLLIFMFNLFLFSILVYYVRRLLYPGGVVIRPRLLESYWCPLSSLYGGHGLIALVVLRIIPIRVIIVYHTCVLILTILFDLFNPRVHLL